MKKTIEVKIEGKKVVVYNGFDKTKTVIPRTSERGIILESFVNNPGRYFPDRSLKFAVKKGTPWKTMSEVEYKKMCTKYT
jgi:hypothetical protein